MSSQPNLPDGWHYAPMASLIEEGRRISYGIVQPGRPHKGGVPVIRVNNFKDGALELSEVLEVDPALEERFLRTRLRGGELLVTLVGSVGQVAVAPAKVAGWNIARAVGVLPIAAEPGADWVSLWLRSPAARAAIDPLLNTTVQSTLNLKDLSGLEVPVPSRSEREAILSILISIEDKIRSNNDLIDAISSISETVFRAWFVDFEPVRENIRGRNPAELAALFPQSLESKADGEIPSGWELKPLSSCARFLNGLALQKYPVAGGDFLPVIKIAELRAGRWDDGDRASNDVPSDYIVDDGDLLFSWSGSLIHRIWCGGRGALNQHLFKVTSEEFPQWFLFEAIQQHMPEFRAIAADKATTMGHIQRRHLDEALVAVPPPPVMQAANEIMSPLHERMLVGRKQSRTLAAIRDLLLPRLMSGTLRVAEAEAHLAEVL